MTSFGSSKLAKVADVSIAALLVLSTVGVAVSFVALGSVPSGASAPSIGLSPGLTAGHAARSLPSTTVPLSSSSHAGSAAAPGASAPGAAAANVGGSVVPGSASSVGDGNDWYADAPSGDVIGVVTGTFPSEAGVTGEVSANGPGGGPACPLATSNCYGLQINTNQFATTYASSGGPINTTGSEQFVYQDAGSSAFMAIWEILYGFNTSCPSPSPSGFSSWDLYLNNCYAHTSFDTVPAVPVTNLSQVSMTAYANQTGSDALVFCVSGSCTATGGADAIGLSFAWTVAEFNVFGDNGGSQAAFNGGAALQVQTQIAADGGGALVPTCAGQPGVHTVEDNNLYLWPCSASASGILFWEANESYGLSASPGGVTVQAGQAASYGIGITSFSGYAAPVQLSLASSLPAGVTSSFPTTVTPPSGGALTLATSSSTPLGDYSITVQAQIASLVGGPGPVATTVITLHVYNFTVALTPSSQTVVRGVTASYAIALALDPGSTTSGVPPIVLAATGLPGDATVSGLNPSGYVLTSPGTTSISLTVATAPAPSGSLGDFPFVITATSAGYPAGAASTGAALHLFDFSVALAPTAETLAQGASTTLTVSVGLVPGSSTVGLPTVALTLAGTPSGVVEVGFPTSLAIGSSQSFTLSTGGAGSYVSCPQVANHPGQNLRGANLAHCDLAGYNLALTNLFDANLGDADLAGASLVASDLAGANLAGANTSGTNFAGANLVGADLSGAGALGTFVLTASGTAQGVTRSGSSTLTVLGDQLSGADFELANLWAANLAGDVAVGTNFQFADLGAANLSGTTANSADFFGANLAWTDLAGSQATNANFEFALLAGADLAGVHGSGANFRYADLIQADLAGGVFVGANFEYADLADANLSFGNFNSANFTGALTKGANITGATFVGAINPP